MGSENREKTEPSYPLRAAARLTGLSPDVLRAWERRHGVVEPGRSEGGTRRYGASDLERLRRVKRAVDVGHRIGQVARLTDDELDRLIREADEQPVPDPRRAVLASLQQMDASAADRQLSFQLSTLGPIRFCHDFALPLLREIGEGWIRGEVSIAAEHLATGVLRSLLGSALRATLPAPGAPTLVFAGPPGERHELGLLMAALVAAGAGAAPIYLGLETPVPALLDAVGRCRARAVSLCIVTTPVERARDFLARLRDAAEPGLGVWIGGRGAEGVGPIAGVELVGDLEALERRAQRLGVES
ncbi:MAG: MerR family transcriptional regulator [Myxococcota bacterium]